MGFLTGNLSVFAVPSYSFRSGIYFEDANTAGLEQDACGLLNFRGGLEFKGLNLILSLWASNLLNEQFIVSAGNAGSLFGAPTHIPGAPGMAGVNIDWRF